MGEGRKRGELGHESSSVVLPSIPSSFRIGDFSRWSLGLRVCVIAKRESLGRCMRAGGLLVRRNVLCGKRLCVLRYGKAESSELTGLGSRIDICFSLFAMLLLLFSLGKNAALPKILRLIPLPFVIATW